MQAMQNPFSQADEQLVNSIIDKVRESKDKKDPRIMDFDFLFSLLDETEKKYVEQVLDLNPADFGIVGEKFDKENLPSELITLPAQKINSGLTIDPQYLSQEAHDAFQKMNSAMRQEIGAELIIVSGYRSPAYQTIVFLWNLRDKKFDLEKTLRAVSLPGYSEHGSATRQAMDFITPNDAVLTDNSFSETTQYGWLCKNAARFNFYESFPKDNSSGIIWEPWHWHYRP